MVGIDRVLGIIEAFAVPVSLALLFAALVRPTPTRTRYAFIATVVVGLTVAQPFGIVAKPQSRPPPVNSHAIEVDGVHVARLFGVVPVLPYEIYYRKNLLNLENVPEASIRARSWFWLPLLTNSRDVADICSNSIFTPCWEPESTRGFQNTLTASNSGGNTWLTLRNYYQTRSIEAHVPTVRYWKLEPGVASGLGLAYWIIAGAMLLVIRCRRPRRRAASQLIV
jgi:hypothetical protein